MKKIRPQNLILLSVGLSVVISAAIAIPIGISSNSQSFASQLKLQTKKLDQAKNLLSETEFSPQEFIQILNQIKPKTKFLDSLSANQAVEFHFDKSYNFDLNSVVDFEQILKKFPNFEVKLLVPADKKLVKVKDNKIENLSVNLSNKEKNINFNAKFNLEFSQKPQNSDTKPENMKAVLQLNETELTKSKSTLDVALSFSESFSKNFAKLKDSQKALFETFSQFGGVSLFNKSKNEQIFPLNFTIKPFLEAEKLIFPKIDSQNSKLELQLLLVETNTKKETNLVLEFENLPEISKFYAKPVAEIFAKNYQIKPNLMKNLTDFGLSPLEIINNINSEKVLKTTDFANKNLKDFTFWFEKKVNQNELKLDDFKDLFLNFQITNFNFSLQDSKFSSDEIKKFKQEEQFPLSLQFTVKPKKSEFLKVLDAKNQDEFTLKLNFNFDFGGALYSSYLEKTLDPVEKEGLIPNKNIENLNFEVKEKLATPVFASTIDQTINHLKNKPLPLDKVKDLAKPLFDLLNFTTKTEEKTKAKLVSVSSEPSLVDDSKEGGKVLEEVFDKISKVKWPKNTYGYLRSEFNQKYKIIFEIKNDGKVQKHYVFTVDSILPDNKAFNSLLEENANIGLFLDYRSLVKTTKSSLSNRRNVDSISSVVNPEITFNSEPEKKAKSPSENVKPYLRTENSVNDGILLTDEGITFEKKSEKLDDSIKNPTFLYVFKPAQLFFPFLSKFYLLQAEKNDNSKSPEEKPLSILVQSYFLPKVNLLGVDVNDKQSEKLSYPNQSTEGETSNLARSTFNGVIIVDNKFQTSKKNVLNKSDYNQDFLNDLNSTIMVSLRLENLEGNKVKIKLAYWTSSYNDGKNPVWAIEKTATNVEPIKFSQFKKFTIGKLFKPQIPPGIKPLGAITFKSLAIFDDLGDKKYKKVVKDFITEYFPQK